MELKENEVLVQELVPNIYKIVRQTLSIRIPISRESNEPSQRAYTHNVPT